MYSELSQGTTPNHWASSVLCWAPFEQAVAVGIVANQVLERGLDPGPEPLQERRVGRHLVLAIGPQDVPGLAVHGRPDRLLGPVADDAGLGVEADALGVVDLLAEDPLQLGEEPRHGLGVVPDVGARPRAAAHALPAVEPAIRKRWQVEVARIDVLAKVRSRNQ